MTEQESARMRRVGSGRDRVTLETANWMTQKALSTHSEHCGNWRQVQQQFGASHWLLNRAMRGWCAIAIVSRTRYLELAI